LPDTLAALLPLVSIVASAILSALLLWRGATAPGLLALLITGALAMAELRRRAQLRSVHALLQQMRLFAPDGGRVEAPGALPDELAPLADALSRVSTRAVEGWSQVARGVEAQGRLREELQAMARQLMTVQEDERRVLSRELHDDVGQSITAIKLCALALAGEDPDARAATASEIVAIADETMAKLRNLSLLLRPPQLDMLGLEAALKGQADLLARSSRVQIVLEVAPLPQRPLPAVELACFRIAQEAMTNALRHADTDTVSVRLTRSDDALLLEVRDAGSGFIANGRHGLGLITMRERAQQVGGTLEIETVAGHGSCVRAQFPLSDGMPTDCSMSDGSMSDGS
jgi:signal transduction histidine kinase